MTIERDVTRIVRSWLQVDEHESADRVLDNVLALLDATPQRRSWWPARRIADMNSFAKLLIAAAAVVVIAIVGINLLPRTGGDVGAGPVASPSPSPQPSASSSPGPSTSASIIFPPAGALAAGRHTLTEDGIVFSLQVPDGWHSSGLNCSGCAPNAGWLQRGADDSTDPGAVWMPVWSVDGVASDPCAHTAAPVATSATELAATVATLPGTDVVTAPKDVVVGGRPAKHVAIKVRTEIGCPPRDFNLWADNGIFRWATALEETNRVWIVDLGTKRFWIEAETYKGAARAIDAEIQGIVDSIQFE
jgi:hypothetical protein